jgi:hypothetical protein
VKRAPFALAIVTIIIVCLSIIISANWFTSPKPNREFYVGAEYAYGDSANEVKALVDKVKDYTNFIVLGSVGLSFNESALTEACDYISKAELHFIIMFTDITQYTYNTSAWTANAKTKYGSLFLGIYRYDEPGGIQLDQPKDSQSIMVSSASNYSDAAQQYITYMYYHVDYYHKFFNNVTVLTADYGLFWFDYKSSYDTILAEFVWNQSRQIPIALCRGAAQTQGKDWGTIITWKYDKAPYLESGEQLYTDLRLAYEAGAKYAVVFSYPTIGEYGTLTEEHFDAMKRFWDSIQNDQDFGSNAAEVAYVVPKDYGFGFRSAQDTIWGLFKPDDLSTKIWSDVNALEGLYGSRFNILYDDNLNIATLEKSYGKIIFWNQTVT